MAGAQAILSRITVSTPKIIIFPNLIMTEMDLLRAQLRMEFEEQGGPGHQRNQRQRRRSSPADPAQSRRQSRGSVIVTTNSRQGNSSRRLDRASPVPNSTANSRHDNLRRRLDRASPAPNSRLPAGPATKAAKLAIPIKKKVTETDGSVTEKDASIPLGYFSDEGAVLNFLQNIMGA